MSHWAARYVGRAWAEHRDCGAWFRLWSRLHFGRRVPPIVVDHGALVLSAARVLDDETRIRARYGFARTISPAEGDAVFLSQRARPHHVGMAVLVDGQLQVLHALEGVGVMLSSLGELRAAGWRLAGFWGWVGRS